MPDKLKRQLLIILGTICVATGVIGIFIPILPTTPFLLLAAILYMRSSERFYRWLLNNRLLGTYIKNYLEGRGMPLKVKAMTVSLLWATIGISIGLASPNLTIKVVLIIIAIGVTLHIIFIRARRKA